MECPSFNAILQKSITDHWDKDALSDYGTKTFQYKDVARIIEKLHIILEASGVERGDKVAICGRNTSRWGIAFLATLSYGAVAVPILHEFHPEQIHDIVNHSESKLLFVGDQVWPNLDPDKMPCLEGIFANSNDEYRLLLGRTEKVKYARENLNRLFGERFPMNFRARDISYYIDSPDELAVLNYTSGTTSNSKGVMIPYRALWSNVEFAHQVYDEHVKAGDNIVSILPTAHMYGMAFEFLYEMTRGAHVHFLGKTPSPTVLLKAFSELKPKVVIAVPLLIEKVVRKAIFPKIKAPAIRLALMTPLLRDRVKTNIRRKMQKAFGDNFFEIIVGGAAMNHDIEVFLKGIRFNYTIGYGATECAPIICYAPWDKFKQGSCGKAAPRMEIRIDSPDPANVPGEILARGMNVMLGYYKNEEATAQTLDKDGWYHTGDLGVMDAEGNVFIKGRSKNMLLGANGQNIYPEEIEDKLSSLPYVTECVVIQKGDKLYGLVYADPDEVKKGGLTPAQLDEQMEQNRIELNKIVPLYAKVHAIKLMAEEFEKTPKKSIKRYKYTNYPV
ncbi:MAG: AMP-binding protein [Bacteroidaceae bacterium]|nr:AMP-binding protein [Bacteroidaceae bacterium]MBQ9191600.1 AMP-binding protein [Bacteroidaceae bacterium]